MDILIRLTILYIAVFAVPTSSQDILEDSRILPGTDGSFGFLYRTQDGISHGAKSASDGKVSGRFTYTDPSGFKINYNYNTATVPQRRPTAGRRIAEDTDFNYQQQMKRFGEGNSYNYEQTTPASRRFNEGNSYNYDQTTPVSRRYNEGNSYNYDQTTPVSRRYNEGNSYNYEQTTPISRRLNENTVPQRTGSRRISEFSFGSENSYNSPQSTQELNNQRSIIDDEDLFRIMPKSLLEEDESKSTKIIYRRPLVEENEGDVVVIAPRRRTSPSISRRNQKPIVVNDRQVLTPSSTMGAIVVNEDFDDDPLFKLLAKAYV